MSGLIDVAQVLARSQTDGTAVASSTTRTSLTPANARYTTRTTGFWEVGKVLRVTAMGRVSTTTGTNNLTLAFGVGSVDAFTTGAMTLVASKTNVTWRLELDMTVRAVGAGGSATANLIGDARFTANDAYTGQPLLPATAPATGTSFDPGAASVLDLFATWSVSSASNSILCHRFVLQALN
jgi:hypothetical protein